MKCLRPALALTGLLTQIAAAAAELPNAWQITDSSSSVVSGGNYSTNLPSPQQSAALTEGWRLSVNCRLVDDFNNTATMVFLYGVGTNRFSVYLDLDANKNLTATPFNQPPVTLTTNGTGSALYRTHEIVYNPTNKQAAYLFDGIQRATWPGDGGGVTAANGLIVWGSGSTAGQGQINFNAVAFVIGTNAAVAYYAAGTQNNPTNAPDPRTQGWTVSPATGADTNGVSPDTALLPVATTLPADHFTNNSARLNGQVNPRGSPAMAWFEWGTTLAYGNATTPQPAGSGVSLTNTHGTITNPAVGTTYYFRAVGSNTFGLVTGTNQSFMHPGFVEVNIPGVLGVERSSVAWGDFNNDGRLDLLTTGEAGGTRDTRLLRNLSAGFANSNVMGLRDVSDGAVAWGDYDNDGGLDFLLTGYSFANRVAEVWHNPVSAPFVNVTASVAAGLPGVTNSSVAWGDYDNDGRLDFLLTGSSSTGFVSQLWRNTGSGFTNVPIAGLPAVSSSSVAWGDFNNDGQLDFLLTGEATAPNPKTISQLWRNTDSGFTNATPNVAPGLPAVRDGSVAWGDYDNDGRLDFLLTGFLLPTSAVSQLWRNLGSGFSNVTASVAPGLPAVRDSSVAWGDYDNDGRLDFLITGFSPSSGPVSQLWRNTASGFSNFTASVAPGLPGVTNSSVAWGDYNNDGRLDFVLTGSSSTGLVSQLWQNNLPLSNVPPVLPVSNAPPTAPTGLSAAVTATTVSFSWNPAADDLTPPAGLNYNVRIGTTPGASDVLAPMALANGRRLLPTLGNAQSPTNSLFHLLPGQTYYWSVQAIDTSFAGSSFATEQEFFTLPLLVNLIRYPGGNFEFYFTNQNALNFDVLVSTNVAMPWGSWSNLGPALHLGGGYYRFTDAGAVGQSRRYYTLRSQ